MGSPQNKRYGKLKNPNSFYYCSNSPKGLLEQLRIIRIRSRGYPEQFYKIEFFPFRSPQIFEMSQQF